MNLSRGKDEDPSDEITQFLNRNLMTFVKFKWTSKTLPYGSKKQEKEEKEDAFLGTSGSICPSIFHI